MNHKFDKSVLILCHDTVGPKMAGPGIRYQNLAGQMKKVADVTLGVFYSSKEIPRQKGTLPVKSFGDSYKPLFDKHQIIFAQWLSADMLKYAYQTGKIIIIDLYAPVPIEFLASLEFAAQKVSPEKDAVFSSLIETYKQYFMLGDYFVCSNDRQRDFWYGFMTAANIISPTNFKDVVSRKRIGLCPMGISAEKPSSSRLELRKRAGLSKDDFVLLWTGGIWDWFDARVVIRAIKLLDNSKIKLVFMGTQHPNTQVYKEEMSESLAARKLSEELKLTGKSVFFLDGWVDYDKRADYLMDADAAIYADKESIETRFSHRTRVLDHIWTSLPTISSSGDYLSQDLETKGMAITAASRSPEAFAKVIKQAYDDPKELDRVRKSIAKHRGEYTWDGSTAELLEYIKHCQPNKSRDISFTDEGAPVISLSYRAKIPRRVKNSIKVLIGRLDV